MRTPAATDGGRAAVISAYRAGRPLALLFDYDGTLTPIARHPSQARLPDAARDRLARLAGLPDVAVGVVSGRALDEVRALVGLDELSYAGSGGLEVALRGERAEDPGGREFRVLAARLERDLGRVLARFQGTWLERKPVALAIHYRGLSPAATVRLRAEAAAGLDRHPRVEHREVTEAVEVTPAGGWEEGTAVELILGRLDPNVFPVYVGDAASDAEPMAVAAMAGGVAVGVGPGAPPIAAHRVASADELNAWLDCLDGELLRARNLRPPPVHGARPTPDRVRHERTAPPADRFAPSGAGGSGPTGGPVAGPGVLLATPDGAFRSQFATAFGRQGWRVFTAADPAAALAAVGKHGGEIDAALVDLQFPGLEGWRVLTELGRRRPRLVRCGVSEGVTSYAAAAFRRLSPTPLFAKPLDAAAAAATLRGLIAATPDTCEVER